MEVHLYNGNSSVISQNSLCLLSIYSHTLPFSLLQADDQVLNLLGLVRFGAGQTRPRQEGSNHTLLGKAGGLHLFLCDLILLRVGKSRGGQASVDLETAQHVT